MLNMPAADIKRRIQEQTDLSEADINKRVQEKMKQLAGLISEEGACHIIANELGVQLLPAKEDRTSKDLLPGMRDVAIDVRVVQVYEMRTFTSKFGDGQGKVCSFLAGDAAGLIRITCWGDHAETVVNLNTGDVVRITNAYVKDNNGRAELHCNNNTTLNINPEGVTVDMPERPERNEEYVRRTITELSRGDTRIELLGTVVQVYDPRFFEKKDGSGPGVVCNVLLDDGTGNIRCACWGEQAAQALGMELGALLENQDGPFDEERTALLGTIIKVRGRAKLNTVYNTIEVNVDALDLSPDAAEELKRIAPDATLETQEDQEPKKTPPKPTPKRAEPEPLRLDDLEDLDLEDVDP